MSEEDDGAPERPVVPKKPPALPRPGTSSGAKPPPPPPLPTAAKATPPPPPEQNPFLPPESSRELDDGWLAPEDAAEALSVAPAAPEEPAADPISLPPPIAAPPPAPIAEIEAPEPTPIAAVEVEPAKPETPAPLPPQKRSRAKVLAFVIVPVLLVLGGGFAYQTQSSARSAKVERAPQSSADTTVSVEPPAPVSEPPPPPTHTTEPPPSASTAKKPATGGAAGAAPVLSADPSKTGILDTTALPAGRKIIVDGRMVGSSPRRVVVRCGVHQIKIGDLPPERLELPCGGEISFTD